MASRKDNIIARPQSRIASCHWLSRLLPHFWAKISKTRQKLDLNNSWNWSVTFIHATVWHILGREAETRNGYYVNFLTFIFWKMWNLPISELNLGGFYPFGTTVRRRPCCSSNFCWPLVKTNVLPPFCGTGCGKFSIGFIKMVQSAFKMLNKIC